MVQTLRTGRQRGISNSVAVIPVRGENTRDLPTLIDASSAVKIQNYEILGDGRLRTRKGQKKLKEIGAGSAHFIYNLTNDIQVLAYDNGTNTVLVKYDIINNTATTVHTFSSRERADGVVYGKFFIAGTKADKMRMIYADGKFLNYVSGSEGINTETITGATSGATAVLTFNTGAGASGTYLLTSVNGTFQNGESLNGSVSGAAFSTVSGTLYDAYELATSPKASNIAIYNSYTGTHLLAGDVSTNESYVQWSKADTDNLVIPFRGSWTPVQPPDPTDAGFVLFRGGGKVNSLVSHRNKVFVFYDDATLAFKLETTDVSTKGLSQNTIVLEQEFNFGGYRGAIATPFGVVYANEKGVWLIDYSAESKNEVEISNILGEERLANINFSNVSMAFDGANRVYICCGDNSETNNLVLVYDLPKQAWTRFTGWYLNAICAKQGKLYGVDARAVTIYELLNGYSDNGENINCEVKFKEEDFGAPFNMKQLRRTWIKVSVNPYTCMQLSIDRWDYNNNKTTDYVSKYLGGITGDVDFWGLGKQAVGKLMDETEVDYTNPDGLTEVIRDASMSVRSFRKIQYKITAVGKVPHEIHNIQRELIMGIPIRNNNLSTVSCYT